MKHIYDRTLIADSSDSLSRILKHVPEGARVLDVGVGSGALGRWLQAERGCCVDGVTYNSGEAARAQDGYRRLQVADLEQISLATLFDGVRYDCIVLADVLEHLRNPEEVLVAAKTLLVPGGRILVSLPNVTYAGLVAGLLAGEFNYGDEGLLDRTHVRFFTRKTMLQMLDAAGFFVWSLEGVSRPLDESEFASLRIDAWPSAVRKAVLGGADAPFYQFVVEARAEPAITPVLLDDYANVPELRFISQLFWKSSGVYSQDNSVFVKGVMGKANQTLRFCLPQDSEVDAFRLDPSDRPGYWRCAGVRVMDGAGDLRWSWTGDLSRVKPSPDLLIFPDQEQGLLMVGIGDDPFLEFELGQTVCGATIEFALDWPISSDSIAWAANFQSGLREDFRGLQLRHEETLRALNSAVELNVVFQRKIESCVKKIDIEAKRADAEAKRADAEAKRADAEAKKACLLEKDMTQLLEQEKATRRASNEVGNMLSATVRRYRWAIIAVDCFYYKPGRMCINFVRTMISWFRRVF